MKKSLTLILIMLHALGPLKAQKVGLVLSGGGAKGMAHIAVIRVLEEHNIPIDYIAGTSIGAIVGGLYAAGYTPDEMEALFKSDDFYFWSTGKIQREYRYYFKQAEAAPDWLNVNITKKKEEKFKLLPPSYIVPTEQMDFAFMELTAGTNAACNYDFNQLMVPFLCIAANVNESQPVVLRKGDLGSAIRASMTVPLYFKPIKIDGNLLFDGGLLNNFPTREMKENFNPDVIIGHKVANDKVEAQTDDVMSQISNMVMRPTDFTIEAKDGILLETSLKNVGLLDFNKIDYVMAQGEETAIALLDSVKNIISRRVSTEELMNKRRKFNAQKPIPYFQNIQVEGVSDPLQRKFIIQSMKHGEDVVPISTIKTEYFKLVADEHLKSIQPVSRYNPESGYFDLHLKVEQEKKMDISIGGNISTKPINQGYVGFNYRTYNRKAYTLNSNIYFGRFYSSFKLGGRIDYPTKLPFYLSSYITFNRWDYFSSSSEWFFEDVSPPYIIQDESNFRIEGGFPLKLHSKFYGGFSHSNSSDEYYQNDVIEPEDLPDQTTFKAFAIQAGLENNSFNYKQYATEGTLQGINLALINGKETHNPGSNAYTQTTSTHSHNYFLLRAHTLRHYSIGRNLVFGTHLEGVLSNKELFTTYKSTMLSAPGFTPTPHSKSLFIENFHSNNFIAGGLKAFYKFTPSMHLRTEAYAFVPLYETVENEDLTASKGENLISNYYLQGLAALVYQTGIGPVSLALNYYENEGTEWYFTLNFGYILFNRRGF